MTASNALKKEADPNGKKRRHTRFRSDMNTFAWITMVDGDGKPCGPSKGGIAIDESYEGCSVIMQSAPELRVDESCVVTLGGFKPVPGKIAWIREIEPGVIRLGISMVLPK